MGLNADEVYALLNKKIKSGGGGVGVSVQSDYSQNDSTQPDYIKNRPFYSEYAKGEILTETTVDLSEGGAYIGYFPLILDEIYTVNWNGVAYECIAKPAIENGTQVGISLGNIGAVTGENPTDEPFVLISATMEMEEATIVYPFDGSVSVIISISGMTEIIHPLEGKYVPDTSSQFIVNFTPNTTGSSFVADKKASEILKVFEEGKKEIVGILDINGDCMLFKLTSINRNEKRLEFVNVEVLSDKLSITQLYYNDSLDHYDANAATINY